MANRRAKHPKGHIDLFEGGAAQDFTNAELSSIFETHKPEKFLTEVGPVVQFPKFLNTVDYQSKAPKPPRFMAPAVHYGNDNVKVMSDFAKDPGTTGITFETKDGNHMDVVKMMSKNVDALGKDVKFQPVPKIERLRPAFEEDIETLLRSSLQEQAMTREATFREALLAMGLTEAEIRAAQTAEKVRQATRAVEQNRAEQFARRQEQLGLNEAAVRARLEREQRAMNEIFRGRNEMRRREALAQLAQVQAEAAARRAAPAVAAALPAALGGPVMPIVEGPPVGAAQALADERIAAALAAPGAAERPAGGAGRPMVVAEAEIGEVIPDVLERRTLSVSAAEALLKSRGIKIRRGEGKEGRMLAALLEAGLVAPGSKVQKGARG